MRDAARTFEGFESLHSVKQIDRNVLVAAFGIRFATRDGDHIPVVQSKKMAQKISARDSRRAGNQRLLAVRHGRAIFGADGFSQFSPRGLALML